MLDIINTGKSIKELKTGDHLCLIYESEEEWKRVVTEFIKDGLERGEKCIYIYNSREPDKLRDYFTEIMALNNLEDPSSFVFHSFRDLCGNIEMDQYAMIYFLSKLSERSISEGYTGLRIAMEMKGSDDSLKSQDMLKFEARLNRYLFSKYPCLALCLYDQREHDPKVIKDIIVTHPIIVRGDRLYSNCHYMKPADILGKDKEKQAINKLLDVIEKENKNNDSLQFLYNVFNESLLAFCALSCDGVVMVCNRTFCEMTGYSSEQIYQNVRFLELISQEYWDIHRDALKNLNISGAAQRYEGKIIRHDASSICVEILLHKSKPGESKDSYYFMFLNDITEFKLNEKRLIFLSQRDSLTGLYNRGYFEEVLHHQETNKGHLSSSVGIIVCDVDGLKELNDTQGHKKGDELLIIAARLIREPFQKDDLVARIGGDEFVVLLPNSPAHAVEGACQRIRHAIERYNAGSPELPLSISIGFAVGNPQNISVRDLLIEADDNMYREKLLHFRSPQSALVTTLMKALEARDFITEGHAERLQRTVINLGEKIGLPEYSLNDLQLLAQFHDIGKIGIPDRILFKPGKLRSDELVEMQRHCEIGYRIALSAPALSHIADWILKHHEWWDGSGYPIGLSQEEIPLECRILSIADAFDAMTNNRPYRKAMPWDQALSNLEKGAGTQFDPCLVKEFVSIVELSGLKYWAYV